MTDQYNVLEVNDALWSQKSQKDRAKVGNHSDDSPPSEFDAHAPRSYGDPGTTKGNGSGGPNPELEVHDAGDIDLEPLEPREWVFGHRYCLGFVSGNIGNGGVGKTAPLSMPFR